MTLQRITTVFIEFGLGFINYFVTVKDSSEIQDKSYFRRMSLSGNVYSEPLYLSSTYTVRRKRVTTQVNEVPHSIFNSLKVATAETLLFEGI